MVGSEMAAAIVGHMYYTVEMQRDGCFVMGLERSLTLSFRIVEYLTLIMTATELINHNKTEIEKHTLTRKQSCMFGTSSDSYHIS